MRVRLQLELPADASLLPRTRWALAGYIEELGAGPEVAGDVILALDEACANVVRHAFPPGTDGSYRLLAELEQHGLVQRGAKASIGFAGPNVEGVAPVEVTAPSDPNASVLWIAPRGASGLHGWGTAATPDRTLYTVRGFDASTNRFLYTVNPRFGSTSP